MPETPEMPEELSLEDEADGEENAEEVGVAVGTAAFPQGLKPGSLGGADGGTEVPPLQNETEDTVLQNETEDTVLQNKIEDTALRNETVQVPEAAKENEAMIDIHPAQHAASSWQEFFIHIATIVLGLCIAVGLEQAVEWVHHRREVAETRELLRQEREHNRENIANASREWRLETARYENDLLVFQYLQKHPGTPEEKLPGRLLWGHAGSADIHAVWDTTQQNGVASLMPRDELEADAWLYRHLENIGDLTEQTWLAVNDAEEYNLLDSNPSHLTPAQVEQEIELTKKVLAKQYQEGVGLWDLATTFPDFSPSITRDEFMQMRHPPNEQAERLLAPASKLMNDRIQAQGGGEKLKLTPAGNTP